MSRPVTVTISHELGADGARARLQESFSSLKSALGGGLMFVFEETWTSENQLSFAAKGLGQNIVGVVDIFPQHIRIQAELPNVLAALADVITGKLEKEGTLLLEKR
ncbi:MAG: polyhydroxyalkanoic acid system family protein [Parvularculaceae bacterium]|nr:polyhydroxyalkanoic acid system family protein [Parvularculaceae bacterium]